MRTNSDQNSYFISAELSLIAFLRVTGYQIEKTEHQGRQVVFYIRKDSKLEKNIKDFWSHEARISPLAYFNALKEVKSFIYQK